MLKFFRGSLLVTILGFIGAYFWGEHVLPGSGAKVLFIVFFLSILEVTLSFDNAVVNALILEKMAPIWQKRFLSWGIIIAVFGMRFLFPVIIVAAFSGLSLLKVTHMAFEDVTQYTHYLHIAHSPLVAFGGAFLMMVALSYFIDGEKITHWIKPVEKALAGIQVKYIDVMVTIFSLYIMQAFLPETERLRVILSGLAGVFVYMLVNAMCGLLEKAQGESLKSNVAKGGFMMFMYLELIDASFSLDGVLGSFAISKDIVIISVGLAIGAMFVRSLTLLLVDKKTLQEYIYLAPGAHWAILSLAMIMFISTTKEVNEVITGTIGLFFVIASFVASYLENKKNPHVKTLDELAETECITCKCGK